MIFPRTLPRLAAERLVLRSLDERDLGPVFEIFSDAETMRYWSAPPMADRDEARTLLSRAQAGFAEGRAFRWAVARRADDRLLGTCSLFALDEQNRRAEIGYILGRAHWGQGLMREALAALLDFAFGDLRLHRIEADVDPLNAASIRTLEHLGFAREGLLRERWLVAGRVADSLLMGLLSRDWQRGSERQAG
jgi:[ribosomal protein S5]-alanine N-acetyltransferase